MFGDGTIDFRRNPVTGKLLSARYREKQGLIHWDWVKNQQTGLKPLTDLIQEPEPRMDKRGYWFVEARTSRSPELTVYGDAFYEHWKINTRWKAVKRVPLNSGEFLDNPLSLAAWVAGDGRRKENGAFTLCTQGFTVQDNHLLCDIFQQNFKILCQVRFYSNGKKKYPELYFRKDQGLKLLDLCDKEISTLESIKHKFFQ